MDLFSRFKTKKKKTRRKKKRKGNTRIVPLVLGLALVAIIAGVGFVKWSGSNSGQAALLVLGSEKMYDKVQLAVAGALAEVLPGFQAGAAGTAPTAVNEGNRAEDFDWPVPDVGPAAFIRCRVVEVDPNASYWTLQLTLEKALNAVGAGILWSERLLPAELPRKQASAHEQLDFLRLDIGVSGRPTHTLILHRPEARGTVRWGAGGGQTLWTQLVQDGQGPVVALVIDDWGYKKNDVTKKLLSLKAPLTLAVLPDLSFSRHFALQKTELILPVGSLARSTSGSSVESSVELRRAAGCFVTVTLDQGKVALPKKRREIILHLPMEPQGYPRVNPGDGPLLVGMSHDAIQDVVEEALAHIPNVTGVNNHMGSAATSDRPTMKNFMDILSGRGLFFVDSLTSSNSVAYDEAVRHGIPSLKNRIFLDYDNENYKQVQTNLKTLVRSARATGFAVGIGHPHPVTADVLLREIPRLQKEGVRFVTISEMMALKDLALSGQEK